jgi:hypothetical protein
LRCSFTDSARCECGGRGGAERRRLVVGIYVKLSDITVNQYLDEYFVGTTRGRRESIKISYRDAFRPVRGRLGERKLQSVTKADIEKLVDWMPTSARKRGGKSGTGLGPRSVRLAGRDGATRRRPAQRLVRPTGQRNPRLGKPLPT